MLEDSLATSTAILAAPYATFQLDSLEDSGSSLPIPEGSRGDEHMDKAIELDEVARIPGFLALEWASTTPFLIKLVDVGG